MRFKRDVGEWMYVRDSELWNLDASESGILPALKLSYSHLPLHLKRCLSFCSIFPRSYEFRKEKLIHLWMAGGFIQSSVSDRRKKLEDFGNDYFTDLEWMSFFQEIKQCENDVLIRYKMHDVIYDLVRSITSSEYTILDRGFATPTSFRRIRHSSVVCDFSSSTIPEKLYEAGHHLRTLLLYSEGNFNVLPEKFFKSLKYLFVLDLSGSGLIKLESSIGFLLHLTYLDLSHTPITNFPPQIEYLHSLQTLELFNCYNLLALPDLTKLKGLRHLNNEGCRKLTKMLEYEGRDGLIIPHSIQLQTLPLFVVGGNFDLKFLSCLLLRGSLKVTHLENADDGELGLNQNNEIQSLGLYWGSDDGCPNINPEGEFIVTRFQERKQTESSGASPENQLDPLKGQELLRSLKPSFDLKRLLIKGYPGFRIPRWNIPNLEVVDFINCQCNNLPCLGNLKFLTCLSLRKMPGLSWLGSEFYYNVVTSRGSEQAFGSNHIDLSLENAVARNSIVFNHGMKPFPLLKDLILVDLPNLCRWDSPGDAFPNLRKLVLHKCPKLIAMPEILSLHHLELQDVCVTLLQFFRKLGSLETLVIEGIRDLVDISGTFVMSNFHLTTLEIKSCHQLSVLPNDLENLTALKSLVIRWCEELEFLPQSLQYLSALESLEIGDCHSLRSLPDAENRGLSNLRSLSIENCNNLRSLSMGFQHLTSLEILTIMHCPSLAALPQSIGHLSALRSLSIMWCQKLMFLPEELQNLTVLHSLEIRGCSRLQLLPEWIEKLVSLRSLTISDCESITFLPKGIEHLTALQHLSIQDCPRLQQRCRPETGEDWPKIAQVPYKHIEFRNGKRPREEGSSSSNP